MRRHGPPKSICTRSRTPRSMMGARIAASAIQCSGFHRTGGCVLRGLFRAIAAFLVRATSDSRRLRLQFRVGARGRGLTPRRHAPNRFATIVRQAFQALLISASATACGGRKALRCNGFRDFRAISAFARAAAISKKGPRFQGRLR